MKTENNSKSLLNRHFGFSSWRLRQVALAVALATITVAWAQDPRIISQPKDQTVSVGVDVTFYVNATTTNWPLTFQWQYQSNTNEAKADLAGATTSQLLLTNVTAAQAGYYSVIVSNALGAFTNSNEARLIVDPTFVRVNEGPGGSADGSVSVAWSDYDQDDYPDLFIADVRMDGSPTRNAFWHNNGDGTFTRITTNSPALDSGGFSYPYWVDYDNDGDLDLHVQAAGSALDRCYRNDGQGKFTAVTPEFVKVSSYGEGCIWADFDNDGWLDAFIPRNGGSDLFFRGYPGGLYRSMTTSEVGTLVSDWSYHVAESFDIDNDGWLDVLVAPVDLSVVSEYPCRLYHNEGQAFFSQITEGDLASQTSMFSSSLPLFVTFSAGDYDNDGDFDLMAASGVDGYRGRLYRNDGNGAFTDVAAAAGVDIPLNGYYPMWADFDNDGHLDLLIGGGAYGNPSYVLNTNNVIFHSNGDGTFSSVEVGSPLRDGVRRCSLAWVDYDNDGFLDFFMVNGNAMSERNYLYRNNLRANGNQNHWLKVRLRGKASNSMGVGAKVFARATIGGKGVLQSRQMRVAGFPFDQDYVAHFGLGDATKVEVLRIEWPSGIVQELTAVSANQSLTITETQNPGQGEAVPQVTSCGCAVDGAFELTATCAPNSCRYVLEGSTDLEQWTKVQVRTNTTGTLEFRDAFATDRPLRFYRVVAP